MISVVDIVTKDVRPLERDRFHSLKLNYDPWQLNTVFPVEGGWKIFAGNVDNNLNDGPLEYPHRLYELHGHWDRFSFPCREHTVDQLGYDGELHLMHTNLGWSMQPRLHITLGYMDPDPKFRAVIAIFLKKGRKNKALSEVIKYLPEVLKKYDDNVEPKDKFHSFSDSVNVKALFPKKLDYWTYEETWGTIEENEFEASNDPIIWKSVNPNDEPDRGRVTYIVFKNPIEASQEQLDIMYPVLFKEAEETSATSVTRSDVREGVARFLP